MNPLTQTMKRLEAEFKKEYELYGYTLNVQYMELKLAKIYSLMQTVYGKEAA